MADDDDPAAVLTGLVPIAAAALRETFALAVGSRCVGCGRSAPNLCSECRLALRPAVHAVDIESPGSARITVYAGLAYTGVARRAIPAFKDGGVTSLGRPLGLALRGAILEAAAKTEEGDIELAPVPAERSARRTRGFSPVRVLLARSGFAGSDVLRMTRRPEDQVGLSAVARRANRAGVLLASGDIAGRRFLIIDDLVTTGATILDAACALTAAGGQVLGAATVAATPRRRAREGDPPTT